MKKIILPLLIICIVAVKNIALAAEIPAAPTQNIYVADFAGMIDSSTKEKILAMGGELDKNHKAQVVVVTIETLGDSSLEDYANELFRKWGIGDKNLNNGVLLLIAKNDRKFRIEVGYGLEGAITDGYAGEILDGMTEYFRNENYSTGILQAYSKLTQKIYEEYGAEVPENVAENTGELSFFETIEILGIVGVATMVMYFFIKYVLAFFVAIFVYIFKLIMYAISGGRRGSLNFIKIYKSISSEIISSRRILFIPLGGGGSSGGDSDSGGGYGGGSSGGGGASGGW